MGNVIDNCCSNRPKIGGKVYSQANAKKAFTMYEKRIIQMRDMQVVPVQDSSDLSMFTRFEEDLNIRNVHLEEYENRLK